MKEIHKFIFSVEILMLIVIACRFVQGKLEASQTGNIIEQIEEAEDISEGKIKRVALTFDDGPNETYTGELLDGLAAKHVKATFFLIGKKIGDNQELVKRMFEEGHLLGNHSFDHVNLCELSDKDAREQISKTNDAIAAVTGAIPEFLRPPFGCNKDELDEEMNMLEVMWDVDPRDWSLKDTGTIITRVVTKVEDGDIILLHDETATSVAAAMEIIDILKSRGYEFVTVDELILD